MESEVFSKQMAVLELLLADRDYSVAEICDMEPYNGKYDYLSVHNYLEKAEALLKQQGNRAALLADGVMMRKMQNNGGNEQLLELKRKHFNLQLESQLAGQGAKEFSQVVDGHIVPRAGFVYLTPRTSWGNAPFYSSVKRIGDNLIQTLWFNVGVMLLMCAIVIICLLGNFPARLIKKK